MRIPGVGDLINQFQINYHKFVTNMQGHESPRPSEGKLHDKDICQTEDCDGGREGRLAILLGHKQILAVKSAQSHCANLRDRGCGQRQLQQCNSNCNSNRNGNKNNNNNNGRRNDNSNGIQ